MPLAVYLALESNPDAAIVLSLVLLAVSLLFWLDRGHIVAGSVAEEGGRA